MTHNQYQTGWVLRLTAPLLRGNSPDHSARKVHAAPKTAHSRKNTTPTHIAHLNIYPDFIASCLEINQS